MDELRTKDYELVRTELRHFQRNQLTIISILVTASVSAYAYSFNNLSRLVAVSGFVIPVLFAVLGTLWIDQIYRQRELALYSYILERELFSGFITKGWEHYVQRKRASIRNSSYGKPRTLTERVESFAKSPSLYYYFLFSSGVIVIPVLSVIYCFLQVHKAVNYSSSMIYKLGIPVIIVQVLIEVLYLKNIFKLQDDLEEEVNYDHLVEEREPVPRV